MSIQVQLQLSASLNGQVVLPKYYTYFCW